MPRLALEVADIFRDHRAAWRSANAGHVSLDQLKVMSAIERCRTVALVGLQPTGLSRGGDRQRRLSRGRKQQTVDHSFVVVGDIGDRIRQGEDEVEVADGQQFGLALGEPFLGGGLALGAMLVAAVL